MTPGEIFQMGDGAKESRGYEILALSSSRAKGINVQRSAQSFGLINFQNESHIYKPGGLVLVFYGPQLNKTIKWAAWSLNVMDLVAWCTKSTPAMSYNPPITATREKLNMLFVSYHTFRDVQKMGNSMFFSYLYALLFFLRTYIVLLQMIIR